MELPSTIWKVVKNSSSSSSFNTYQQLDFPEFLPEKYIKQLVKVFSTGIHPIQYLPQLFTSLSASLILRSGVHISKSSLPLIHHSKPLLLLPQSSYNPQSLYLAYSFMKRPPQLQQPIHSTPLYTFLYNNISVLPSKNNNNDDNDDNNNNNNNNNNNDNNDNNNNDNNNNNNTDFNHLQDYLACLKKGTQLNIGATNLEIDTIVVTAPPQNNLLPWFGKVFSINNNTKQVKFQ